MAQEFDFKDSRVVEKRSTPMDVQSIEVFLLGEPLDTIEVDHQEPDGRYGLTRRTWW